VLGETTLRCNQGDCRLSFSRQQRLVLGIVAVAALLIWIVVLLHDDGSVLGILVREVPSYIGWAPDSTAADVLRRMRKYEKKSRYDDAIKAGIAWTEKHPDDSWNGWIYMEVSALYLKKAEKDGEHTEEDVTEVLLYRDKALPLFPDNLYWLQRLAAISESAGDLSPTQRCVQYRNAMKLLDRGNIFLTEEKNRVARQFKPDPADCEQMKCVSEQVDSSMIRLRGKLQHSACE
jgi:hypothetical protein